jgi:hypothetical protein
VCEVCDLGSVDWPFSQLDSHRPSFFSQAAASRLFCTTSAPTLGFELKISRLPTTNGKTNIIRYIPG